MNKKIIAAAVAAVISAPAAMAADTVVYGKVRQSVDFVDMGNGTSNVDNIQINDKSSRLGFKGSEDLGNGLKAVWKMEFGIAISSNSHGNGLDSVRSEFSGSGTFSARNAFVGLAGDFGTALIGRHDHPLKISTGSLDLFADTIADNNQSFTENLTDFRADGTVAYVSPSLSGLTFAAALVPGENANADGISDAYSVAAMYNNGGIYASVAYEEGDSDLDAVGATTDYEQTRVGLGYTMDAFTVNVVWADVDSPATTNGETESVVLSGKYTMGNNAIKAKWFDVDRTGLTADDNDGFAIGLEHNFSKRTQAQVVYVSSDQDGANAGADGDVFSLQLNHNF
ncbi:MAG: porin [Chromatiales bacterium]|jgi:predicted porin